MYVCQRGVGKPIVYKSKNILDIFGRKVDIVRDSLGSNQQVSLGTLQSQREVLVAIAVVKHVTCQIDIIGCRPYGLHFRLSGILTQRFFTIHVSPNRNGITPVRERLRKNNLLYPVIILHRPVVLFGYHTSLFVVDHIIE